MLELYCEEFISSKGKKTCSHSGSSTVRQSESVVGGSSQQRMHESVSDGRRVRSSTVTAQRSSIHANLVSDIDATHVLHLHLGQLGRVRAVGGFPADSISRSELIGEARKARGVRRPPWRLHHRTARLPRPSAPNPRRRPTPPPAVTRFRALLLPGRRSRIITRRSIPPPHRTEVIGGGSGRVPLPAPRWTHRGRRLRNRRVTTMIPLPLGKFAPHRRAAPSAPTRRVICQAAATGSGRAWIDPRRRPSTVTAVRRCWKIAAAASRRRPGRRAASRRRDTPCRLRARRRSSEAPGND